MSVFKKYIKNEYIGIGLFTVFFAGMYIWRMFNIHPWYDELYTYYTFISKGPVYAAIHWPLPNNHVGYSVISGFFNVFGSPIIALRGASLVAAVANIILIYILGLKFFDNIRYALAVVGFYGAVNIVNALSVQGRGYTLSTTCMLLSIIAILKIFDQDVPLVRWYVVFGICLALGIYIIPSSTFWVIPVCFTGGFYLLFNHKYKSLIKLIVSALVAAAMDLFLYATIWLAVGSNLLSKSADSAYFGLYQLDVIKKAPFTALQTGLDYMLASPYIQSVDRHVVITGLIDYIETLFAQFYSGCEEILMVLLIISMVIALIRYIKDRTEFRALFLFVFILLQPILLIIQSQQPYLRVFTFFGFVAAVAIVYICKGFRVSEQVMAILAILLLVLTLTPGYRNNLGDEEDTLLRCFELVEDEGINPRDIESICYTDDYQKYILKFYYNGEPVEAPLGEAYMVIAPNELNGIWPSLYDENSFNREELKQGYSQIGQVEKYKIYIRK